MSYLHRTGDHVYLRGYHVLTINETVPSTVLDELEQFLDMTPENPMSEEDHLEAMRDLERDYDEQVSTLEDKVSELKEEVCDLENQVLELQVKLRNYEEPEDEEEEAPAKPVPPFHEWVGQKVGTHKWVVAGRLGSRLRGKGYTKAIPPKSFAFLKSQYDELSHL